MKRLHWVRHGPTHARCMVGWSDLPADLGDHAQIARLSACLPTTAPVVSSDLIRARATADALAQAGGRRRLPDMPDLREMHFGDWELRSFSELEAEPQNAALLRAFYDRPGDVRPPGGESWHEVCARVERAVADLLGDPAEELIVTAHFGVILTQVQKARRSSAYEAFAERIEPLSLSTFALTPQGWRLERVNHLP